MHGMGESATAVHMGQEGGESYAGASGLTKRIFDTLHGNEAQTRTGLGATVSSQRPQQLAVMRRGKSDVIDEADALQ